MKDKVHVLFVCGYGVGSSAISESIVKKALVAEGINAEVKHTAVGEMPSMKDWTDIIAISTKLAEGVTFQPEDVKGGALSTQPGQKVEVRCRKENGGFGTGHNTVLPELTSDYHFILNPDIQLTADTLSDLADWMAAHPDAVMARPGLRFPDGRPQSLPLRRCALRPMVYRQLPFLKFWEKYNRAYLMEGEDLSAPVEIEFCTGSFSAVRTAEFKAVGGFDEHYFMYVEDADLTQKMRTTGKAYLVPQYTAIHAWHRAAHRSLKPFLWQTGSLLRYFHKWGFKF